MSIGACLGLFTMGLLQSAHRDPKEPTDRPRVVDFDMEWKEARQRQLDKMDNYTKGKSLLDIKRGII